ncbi:small, acid-soluble spore protein, alpha/beta type [Bacillus fonticola]|uniref:small, acid-soluble spore protein, alpha/beta type n=1 Tax=Bacillus fonticola TaxID=2728853 RepID=UPI0014763E4C|nr:small, acid-soluble spore protein, alpha/beta type [Bacillus fonticola]
MAQQKKHPFLVDGVDSFLENVKYEMAQEFGVSEPKNKRQNITGKLMREYRPTK